jgi:Ca2+:H+ antiporter
MEMMMIAAVMYFGGGGASLGRDTMLAILMVVLNGLVGTSLLVGGLRYHEQTYNLYGANAFLGVIVPLSVLGLVMPSFTVSSPGPTLSPLQSTFLIVMSVGLYGVFLAIQTMRHREYFVFTTAAHEPPSHLETKAGQDETPAKYHALLLLAYVPFIVLLAKQIAKPIDYGINVFGAPAALGGLLVAALILSPESLAAVRAAGANQIQRSINLSLGTALSSISLTIPAVLIIGFLTGKTIILGLEPANMVLLLLTLAVSMLTFALERTNVLQGAIHLLLFVAYLILIFEK